MATTKATKKKKKAVVSEVTVIEATQPKIKNNTLPFMIGADPEFLLFYGSRGLDASTLIKNFFQNSTFEGVSAGYLIPNVGDFGWDGASSTGELRPVATKNIQTMVDNIGTMLKTMSEKMPYVDITTLSIGSSIGGHMHLDDFIHKRRSTYSDNIEEIIPKEEKRVIKVLSTYLIPVAASDHRVSALKRLKSERYGKLNDVRFDLKGDVITAEVRGLTAEWITSPKVAYATLAYVATVWEELKIRNSELAKNPLVIRTDEHLNQIHKLMLSDYKVIEETICKSIKKEIKTFKLYAQFKEEIDFILNPTAVMKEKEKYGWNINQGWGLTKTTKQPTKANLLNKKKLVEIMKTQDIPNVENHFTVNYNDDYNVAKFALAISERVAALNWKINNEYFLFGYKKGIEGYGASNTKGEFYCMPTNEELDTTIEKHSRMRSRAHDQVSGTSRIDPKSGKIKQPYTNLTVIGIPYSDRAEDNINNLIELIWNIENNKTNAKPQSSFRTSITVAKEQTTDITLAMGDEYDAYDNNRRMDISEIISEITEIE